MCVYEMQMFHRYFFHASVATPIEVFLYATIIVYIGRPFYPWFFERKLKVGHSRGSSGEHKHFVKPEIRLNPSSVNTKIF